MSALHVAHDIPGRLRLRLPAGLDVQPVVEAVAAEPGVVSTRWSLRTRSLLVLYDRESGDGAAITEAASRAGGLDVVAGQTEAAPAAAVEPGGTLSLGARQAFGEIDQRVLGATRGLIGLAGLFPVALMAWALTEVVRGRAAPLAWSSALWYAHGLFRDYQVPPTRD